MGNSSLQIIAENVSVIASPKTWIEGGAIQQLQTTAKLPGMHRVVGMPDLHPGRGYPVGAAFFSTGRFYPALIGGDIGCGMRLLKTDLSIAKISLDKLVKRLGNIDAPLIEQNDVWRERVRFFQLQDSGFEQSLGTIGGGNHFAELQQIIEVFDQDIFSAHGLDRKQVMLLVHSGSRGLGGHILRKHIDQFGHLGLAEDNTAAIVYWQQHQQALDFALCNRRLIAERICANLATDAETVLDIHHNFLSEVSIDGVRGFLHRKGAAPADEGLIVIPGSRGDYSFVVQAVRGEMASQSLFSLAHGAGRKWMRSECEARLKQRYTAAQLSRTALDSRVVCHDKGLIFEEAPEAYKPIDSVITSLQEAGLIKVVAKLKPLISYKTSGRCCV
ncbi:RNA ligase RtcB family protein [Undibacterium macrobrachii]|uniref:3'-phosphate/5'-hydroxy nucleic acid ligase n=1 Tax=Undibacterium macrobrachii TaxID=1119058 RepID=A0ABQ2XAY4_9BURK|nr:RNA ligase RtcB family protein [Undibacterium macrobrachii]GGX08504.1 RtcB family protein [Undibacterium macrobrachii]